jgi:hypothetical protein
MPRTPARAGPPSENDSTNRSMPFSSQRMGMTAYPAHLWAQTIEMSDHVPGFAVVAWMTRFPLEHFGEEWLRRGTMTIRYRRHLLVGEPLTINVRAESETLDFEAVRHGGEVVTLGNASLTAEPSATWTEGFDAVAVPNPQLEGVASVIEGRSLGVLETIFDANRDLAFVQQLAADDPWRDRREAHPAFVVSAANVVVRQAIDFADGRWLQGGANLRLFRPIVDGSRLTLTGRIGPGFVAGRRVFSQAEILVAADGEPSMRVDIPFLCDS